MHKHNQQVKVQVKACGNKLLELMTIFDNANVALKPHLTKHHYSPQKNENVLVCHGHCVKENMYLTKTHN